MADYQEILERYKIPLALSLVGIVLIIGGIIASGSAKPREFPQESIVTTPKKITVDVSGAVVTPGVYEFTEGSRIEEAILQAGGFKDEANIEFISKYLNLAQKIVDGSKIYVPFIGEKDTDLAVSGVAGVSNETVNINMVTQIELEKLTGVGPVTAEKIIAGRPYGRIEDLINKKIIGKAVFEKIKASIVVY